MGIELYNRTKYSDEILTQALEVARVAAGVKGDVAVKVLYLQNSVEWKGRAHDERPYFRTIAKGLKKFDGRAYEVNIGTISVDVGEGEMVYTERMATADGLNGWLEVRGPRPRKGLTLSFAFDFFKTMLHEFRHIYQYRHKDEVKRYWNIRHPERKMGMWWQFRGKKSATSNRRIRYSNRPIEIDVNEYIANVMPRVSKTPEFNDVMFKVIDMMNDDHTIQKAKKQLGTQKFNEYGERVSDYRLIKQKTLRNGMPTYFCPHCGEKAIIRDDDMYGKYLIYTHVGATSVTKYEGWKDEYLYTQWGCRIDNETNEFAGPIVYGYPDLGDTEPRIYRYNPTKEKKWSLA